MTYHYKIKFLLSLVCISIILFAAAQDKSNKGKEFWLGYGHNILFAYNDGQGVNSQVLVLYLSAEQAANVTVSVNSTGFSQTVNIPANTVDFSVVIPKSGADDARLLTEGLSTKGIHIESDVPIVAYAHEYGILSSAATMLMPVETFGYTYYSMNYTQTTNYGNSYSWFYVVASENNTRLEITPSDTTMAGWLPNHTYTVNLQKGEIYNVFGKTITGNLKGKDLTGSKVVSISGSDGACHPIGLFSGSSRNVILSTLCNGSPPYFGEYNGNGGELLMQQIFPANAWGTKYITYHTINNVGGNINIPFLNIYRIAVRNPSTIVKRNGVTLTGLTNNFYYEIASNTGDIIESDQPILVAQYTISSNECVNYNSNPLGDPEMIYLSPIEQGVKKAIFYNTRKEQISLSFVNIILPTNAISSLLIDGQPFLASEYVTHPNNSNYTVAVKKLTGLASQHTLTCDSTFIATVYGIGTTESYGYNVGTLVNNLNSYSAIKNTHNTSGKVDTFTCPKTPIRLFVKLAYKATQIQWKINQLGSAISPNTDSVISSPTPIDSNYVNGRKYFTYSLQQDYLINTTGNFQIPIVYSAPDIDACNQTESTTINVVVKPGPIADFTYTNAGCLKDSVHFTSSITSAGFTINKYLWNFDDNTTANTANTVKKFDVAGTQNVRFRIYADNGCAADTTKQIIINYSPVAKLGVSINISCAKDSVLISDTSSIAVGTIASWYYNFGDGNTLTRTTNTPFYHTYNLPGSYTIKLVTTSNNNCLSDTAFKTVTVNAKPVASFVYNNNICVGDSIRFTDQSSITTGTITSWRWNFDDSQLAVYTNNNPFYHSYTTTGNYLVKLATVSNKGCISDTAKVQVSVNSKPVASITFTGNPCVDSAFRFVSSIGLSTGNPPIWYWSFGDGQTLSTTATNVATHSYNSAASSITVKHVVSYGAGCTSDTATAPIPLISINPVASFSIIGDTLCEGKKTTFTATANTAITQWNWKLGNLDTIAVPPFSYAFNNAGNYTTSLTVKANSGCISAPLVKTITINTTPIINAGTDKIITTGGSVMLDAFINNSTLYNFLWLPGTYLSNANVLNPIASPLATTVYVIKASNKTNLCFNTDSVIVKVVNKLDIPNAFSPNGDRINDYWDIQGLELYPDATVSIFNRNGQLLFETKNYKNNQWKGTFNNKPVPVGTYAYIIKLYKDRNETIAGMLTILR